MQWSAEASVLILYKYYILRYFRYTKTFIHFFMFRSLYTLAMLLFFFNGRWVICEVMYHKS